eukprot:TRINITY_DN2018_c0_g1_i1.p1 TRINITY_DN2018_c0_g1~~TRINITY_DN2018_c0_g1_i1.p1  ORF type:complete len:915 (+),score=159.88 TRINITY_DN2018_c0_g1_i1:312-2747(+)
MSALQRQTPPPIPEGYDRKVSTAVLCVMLLTSLSVWMYVCLAIARNVDEMAGLSVPSRITDILTATGRCVYYPPMLACLFVACRLHVLANTEGLGEPQWWVKRGMLCTTASMFFQYFLVLLLIVFYRPLKKLKFSAQHGLASDVHPRISNMRFRYTFVKPAFALLQLLCMVGLYGGAAVVAYGMYTYPDIEKPSPSMKGVVYLVGLYLGIRLVVWSGFVPAIVMKPVQIVSQQNTNVTQQESEEHSPFVRASLAPTFTSQKAPLLCLLFLSARLRAMECDPWNGKPQWWAREAFGYVTIALTVECIFASLLGIFGKAEDGYLQMHVYKSEYRILHVFFHLANFATGFWIWLIMGSIWAMDVPPPEPSKPLPPTLRCIMLLVGMYLLIQACLYVVLFCKHVLNIRMPLLEQVAVAGQASVNFTPVLGVLFFATRMRAVQVTNFQGSPQAWAQDAMYLCVFACILQSICCIALPMLAGNKAGFDSDGNAQYDLGPMAGAYTVTCIKYFVLASIALSVGVISYSVFDISAETANYGGTDSIFTLIKQMALLVVVVLLAMFLSSAKVVGHVVKTIVESVPASAIGGCKIEVDKAVLSLFAGYVNLAGIRLLNPTAADGSELFKSPHLLEVQNVVVQMSPWQMLTSRFSVINVEFIALKGVCLHVEKPGPATASNLAIVKCAMKKKKEEKEQLAIANKPVGDAVEPVGKEQAKKKKTVILHKLDVRSVSAEMMVGSKLHKMSISLADFCYTSETALDPIGIIVHVLGCILKSAMNSKELIRVLARRLPCAGKTVKSQELTEEDEDEDGSSEVGVDT